VLTHRPTGYYFKFGVLYLDFSPGTRLKEQHERYHSGNSRANYVNDWLRELRKEVDAPDLWAVIGQEKLLATAASSETIDNRPFTPNELQLINTKLDEIKGYILEDQSFDADQAEFVECEFAYLRESATRMGRKDWLNIVIGGLVGTIFTLGLDPEKARGLFALAGTVLQSLWGSVQGLLQ
jgi:hypothetical protein